MILVTGGAGFIGSALLWQLNQMGYHEIVISDHMGHGSKWKNLAKRQFQKFVPKEKLLDWLSNEGLNISFDAIFHMGACSSTTETDVDYLLDNNFSFTQSLWKYCSRYHIPFIYASSAATYGNGHLGFSDQDELTPQLEALNPYGFSKLKFDQSVLRETSAPPFWIGLRFFNVYGPNEYHKGAQASVAYHFFPQIFENKTIRLFKSHHEAFKDGQQLRDFVYVKDVVQVLFHFFQKRNTPKYCGIYNVGTGKARTFEDVAKACFQAAQIQPPVIQYFDMPEQIRDQYQYVTEARIDKLIHYAEYSHKFMSLEEGIHDYYTQHLLNKDKFL